MSTADLATIKDRLIERCGDIAAALLSEPNRAMSTKRQFRFGNHGSLAVDVAGPKAGSWKDYESGEKRNDMLALIMRERRVGFADALKIAADLLAQPAPAPARHVRQALKGRSADVEVSDTTEFAADIWRASVAIEGTPAEVYLRKTRRLDIPEGASSRVLRYHGACPFHRIGDEKKIHFKTPALVCLFRDIHFDVPTAIHRIAVTPSGGRVDFAPRKLSLGRTDNAAIKLSAHDEVTIGLAVGEGPESVLAAMMLGFRPAWALCSSGRIRTFPVLSGIEALTILVDHDDAAKSKGGAGQECALACSARWTAAGREVARVVPDVVGMDMADLV